MDLRRTALPLPAFATAVVASLAFGAPAAHAANCPGAGQLPLLSTTATAKSATLCLINEQRAAHGRAALRSQSTLEAAATSYARSMVQQRFFAHVSPSGQGLGDRLASYTRGTRSYAMGENLAWGQSVLGTPAATVDSWMHSQGHRDNILNANFDEIGVGIVPGSPRGGALDAGATYVTEFGFRQLAPGASRTSASAASKSRTAKRSRTKTKKLSAKTRRRIAKQCYTVSRRTKSSVKTRRARYSRCKKSRTRTAQKVARKAAARARR